MDAPDYKKKALLCREFGHCGKLLGKILPIFVLVSTPKYPWDETSKRNFYQTVHEMEAALISEAKRYGKSLSFESRYFYYSVKNEIGKQGKVTVEEILKEHFSDWNIDKLQNYYAEHFKVDSAPFFFVFNSFDRSYAYQGMRGYSLDGEYAILYTERKKYPAHTCMHELLHLYGANDLYYPDELKAIAEKYCPHSIMLAVDYTEVDSFTAYTIGWTDEPDRYAKYFVDYIEWLEHQPKL